MLMPVLVVQDDKGNKLTLLIKRDERLIHNRFVVEINDEYTCELSMAEGLLLAKTIETEFQVSHTELAMRSAEALLEKFGQDDDNVYG